MDLDKILNEALNKALIGKNRIKQVNSNEIADFVNKHLEAINYTHCCKQLPIKKEINFDGNVLAEIETTDKNLKVLRCIDGGGNIINVAKVQIDEVIR